MIYDFSWKFWPHRSEGPCPFLCFELPFYVCAYDQKFNKLLDGPVISVFHISDHIYQKALVRQCLGNVRFFVTRPLFCKSGREKVAWTSEQNWSSRISWSNISRLFPRDRPNISPGVGGKYKYMVSHGPPALVSDFRKMRGHRSIIWLILNREMYLCREMRSPRFTSGPRHCMSLTWSTIFGFELYLVILCFRVENRSAFQFYRCCSR